MPFSISSVSVRMTRPPDKSQRLCDRDGFLGPYIKRVKVVPRLLLAAQIHQASDKCGIVIHHLDVR